MSSHFPIRMLNGVGLVAAQQRNIKSGNEFNGYFPRPDYSDPLFTTNGENQQTIEKYIPEIVNRYQGDTKTFSNLIKKQSLEATLKALFDFIYTHIQYKQDSPFEEQIRRPARTWADRHSGVDCDCYTVFISSVLTNLKIPHYLRMAAYNGKRSYQHIYVVVPKTANSDVNRAGQYFTVDPVMDAFNAEKPYLYKKDKAMSFPGGLNGFPIRMLNGNTTFNGLSDLVYDDVYLHPALGVWSLKGLDGGYYLNGNVNARYVPPVNAEQLGFLPIAAGIKAGSAIFKFGKKLFRRKKKKKKAAPAPVTPVNPTPLQQAVKSLTPVITGSQVSQESLPGGDDLKDLLTNKIQASNKATVLSLKAVDSGIKDTLSKITGSVSNQISTLIKEGSSLKEISEQIKELTSKALENTSGMRKENESIESDTKQLSETLKAETLKSEQFRDEQRTQSRIMMISLVALGVVLVIIAVKKSN